MRKNILFIVIPILMVMLMACGSEEPILLDGPYKVKRVVDGDTFIIKVDGKNTRVRMIGIDTPESVAKEERRNTIEGIEASDFTKNLLNDKQVYLEYDSAKYDKYDRILAYVYLEDKETMVNELILSEGMGRVITVEPNVKYIDRFLEIQRHAREKAKGFWDTYYK